MHDVAVLHHVVLALGAHLPGVLGALLAPGGHEIVVGDDLGPDEALLEIRVDDARRLRMSWPGSSHLDVPILPAGGGHPGLNSRDVRR